MKKRQDYIQFGSSAPIVLAPYETVSIEGSPAIRVRDPGLYIKVRDILLYRQFSMPPGVEVQSPRDQVETAPGSLGEPATIEETRDAPMAQIEASELGQYVDQMLGALPTNNLLQASALLVELIGYLGGDRPELQAIVGIFAKILRNYVKKTQENRENQNE